MLFASAWEVWLTSHMSLTGSSNVFSWHKYCIMRKQDVSCERCTQKKAICHFHKRCQWEHCPLVTSTVAVKHMNSYSRHPQKVHVLSSMNDHSTQQTFAFRLKYDERMEWNENRRKCTGILRNSLKQSNKTFELLGEHIQWLIFSFSWLVLISLSSIRNETKPRNKIKTEQKQNGNTITHRTLFLLRKSNCQMTV